MDTNKRVYERQDYVDNSIFNLLNDLNLSNDLIDWNIEFIGNIRDVIEEVFVENLKICDNESFYPTIKE